MEIEFPDVTVQLTGGDGNAFAIIGAVTRGLKRAGHPEAASKFSHDAMSQGSYDGLLALALRTVNVA